MATPSPADIARQQLARRMRGRGSFGVPVDMTIAGNARISVIATTRAGRPSQTRAARTLRKYAR